MKRLTREEKWMKKAIREAKKADEEGEVPIGAVVVLGDQIVGRGHNKRTKLQLATAHAELMAIDRACKKLGSWRIPECELFVTLEPCPMCMGAVLNARIAKVYYGAPEGKGRSLTSEIASANLLNHVVSVEGGVLEEECREVLQGFFVRMRERTKKEKQNKASND